ncbi:MAG: hypothetical protein ACP5J0_03150 [Pyrobaculum sp.]
MNILEGAYAAALFILSVLLVLYLGRLAVDLLEAKWVFEATRHASCAGPANASAEGMVVAMCIRLTFNGTLGVQLYNISVRYPTAS